MPATVRPASEADIDALIRLNDAVQSLHAELYPDEFKPRPDASALRAFFAAHLSAIALAELDGAAVGYVWREAQSRPETPFSPARPRLFVHHLAVAAQARRRGVGTALMRYVEQDAARQGLSEIALGVWTRNRDALAFFQARGFAETTATLRKALLSSRPRRKRAGPS
ncbi:MAG TPA: GNAT family N-acetyltransferase [Roseiarcus sp.]|nr:GNAT family N-acetyltransferase [Roseiarcus sp.]